MVENEDPNDVARIVDLVDNAEVAPARTVLAFKVEPKGLPDAIRAIGQPSLDEFIAGRGDRLGQTFERTERAGRPIDVERS